MKKKVYKYINNTQNESVLDNNYLDVNVFVSSIVRIIVLG